MPAHSSGQLDQIEAILGQGGFRVILIDSPSSVSRNTPIEDIYRYEIIQEAGGYAPQSYPWVAGSATDNVANNRWEFATATATFTEALANAGYSYTYILLIRGRLGAANKPIVSVDIGTDRITCTGHGLVSGDRVVIRSTGSLPGGVTSQRYWANVIDSNNFELHTNETLTALVNMSSTGVGTLYLQYANGVIYFMEPLNGTINPGASRTFQVPFQLL